MTKTTIITGDKGVAGQAADIASRALNAQRNDLVIGIVSLKGAGGTTTAETLARVLGADAKAECHIFTVSGFIKTQKISADDDNPQNTGNRLRREVSYDVFAQWAVSEIHVRRNPKLRQVFIIDSLKHPTEVDALSALYGSSFWLLAVYCPTETRVERIQKMPEFRGTPIEQIRTMLERDVNEGINWGQKVSDTSAMADYFIRNDLSTPEELETVVRRFSKLVFPSHPQSPSADETGMYLAASAARSSLCLSRQVGASIVSEMDEVIATGYNEVPIASGGHFNQARDGLSDNRCYAAGFCSNDHEKDDISSAIANDLVASNIVDEEQRSALFERLRRGRIAGLLEFSRSIHAEMSAILSAARQGSTHLVGSTMYVTTFPCHNCARHIIAAGVRRVVYIEPYPKSLAEKLHKDSLSLDSAEGDTNKVQFVQYEGIGTQRYYDVFLETRPTKDRTGQLVQRWDSKPTDSGMSVSFLDLEKQIADGFSLEKRLV